MSEKTYSILIVGVGGQGVILASELLSEAAMNAGLDVKKSEVHGMSQRGGVVSSHVRFGKKVYSPLIPAGSADVVLAFEAAEGLRWAGQVKNDGLLVVNTQRIIPPVAFTREYDYPDDPIGEAVKCAARVRPIDGQGIALRLGNVKAVNTVLLGAISGELPISGDIWEAVIKRRVPRGTEEINLAAFRAGIEAVKSEAAV
ncbi:MAG TPA: indolepyruvate oxidoreductase subunit beta [Bacteroidetes bacterium]|nr:indolepyruvate oxidoreductase subunit beta [Bacteroidota bacterium]